MNYTVDELNCLTGVALEGSDYCDKLGYKCENCRINEQLTCSKFSEFALKNIELTLVLDWACQMINGQMLCDNACSFCKIGKALKEVRE